jgi:L-lysine exporter family protein LysE/ArgO
MTAPQLTPFLAGFMASLALIIAIGAQNSFVLRQGLRGEHLLPVTLICAFSDALLIGIGIAGLGKLIEAQPFLLDAIRYGGAAFLAWCAWQALRRAWHGERLEIGANGPGRASSAATAVLTCLGLTFLNPHVYLDTVLLLGSLANHHGDDGRWIFGFGAVAASFCWFFSLAWGARLLVPLFARPAAWRVLDSGIAVVMATLAVGLLAA